VSNDKYGGYIFNDKEKLMVNFKDRDPFFQVRGLTQWPGMACQLAMAPISQPVLMESGPMKHDFDQILCFVGGDTRNIFEFDAETVVYVPKGLTHCPINFKKIGKPIIFLDITLASEYTRKEKTGDGWSGIVKDEDVRAKDVQRYGLK
jgi:hypothetical protein